MSLESGLCRLLKSDPGVKAIVGDKVYPELADDEAAEPYVVFRESEAEAPRDLGGRVISRRHAFEIECWTYTYDAAGELAAAVKKAITGENDEGVRTELDEIPVILFWSDTPHRRQNEPGEDRQRNCMVLNLTVLLR